MVTLWLFCILDYCFPLPLPTLSLPGSFPARREGGFFGAFLGCFDVDFNVDFILFNFFGGGGGWGGG